MPLFTVKWVLVLNNAFYGYPVVRDPRDPGLPICIPCSDSGSDCIQSTELGSGCKETKVTKGAGM